MKWCSHIVVLCLLVVSVEIEYGQPVFVTEAATGSACCAQEKASDCSMPQNNGTDKNEKNTCNPMQECSGCIYCATAPARFSFKIFRQVTHETAAAGRLGLVEYHASFWHPPQNI